MKATVCPICGAPQARPKLTERETLRGMPYEQLHALGARLWGFAWIEVNERIIKTLRDLGIEPSASHDLKLTASALAFDELMALAPKELPAEVPS